MSNFAIKGSPTQHSLHLFIQKCDKNCKVESEMHSSSVPEWRCPLCKKTVIPSVPGSMESLAARGQAFGCRQQQDSAVGKLF